MFMINHPAVPFTAASHSSPRGWTKFHYADGAIGFVGGAATPFTLREGTGVRPVHVTRNGKSCIVGFVVVECAIEGAPAQEFDKPLARPSGSY